MHAINSVKLAIFLGVKPVYQPIFYINPIVLVFALQVCTKTLLLNHAKLVPICVYHAIHKLQIAHLVLLEDQGQIVFVTLGHLIMQLVILFVQVIY